MNAAIHLPKLAVAAADRRRARKEPLGWREALAEAPWGESMPAEHEREFRLAYARRLVERGLARPSGESANKTSGKHARARIKVSYSPEQRKRWERAAKGLPLAQWLADLADAASWPPPAIPSSPAASPSSPTSGSSRPAHPAACGPRSCRCGS